MTRLSLIFNNSTLTLIFSDKDFVHSLRVHFLNQNISTYEPTFMSRIDDIRVRTCYLTVLITFPDSEMYEIRPFLTSTVKWVRPDLEKTYWYPLHFHLV